MDDCSVTFDIETTILKRELFCCDILLVADQ